MPTPSDKRVLAVGIYLLDRENYAPAISEELARSQNWSVDVRWCAIGDASVPESMEEFTETKLSGPAPKFSLLNSLLKDVELDKYQYLLVTDDDIELESGFLDRYLAIVEKRGFSMSQPARSHDSYIDHYFVAQLNGVESRQTRFVEIGPLFCLSRTAFPIVLPFNEDAPMGWGLDLIWPTQLEAADCSLGIVDATPVKHRLRKPVSFYDYDTTNQEMKRFLDSNEHLEFHDAYLSLDTHPLASPNKQN